MDDVSPRIMFQCRIIFVKFTGNDLLREARSWSHPSKHFLQALQIMDVISKVNFIFVQVVQMAVDRGLPFWLCFLGSFMNRLKWWLKDDMSWSIS